MPRRILIVFGTKYGQTAKVAGRIADQLTAGGDAVVLERADELPRAVAPGDFDGVIVGGSIIYGHHQRSVRRFVSAHRDALNAMPSAFFSVSGSAASKDEAGRAAARRCVDEFLRETGWSPALTETVAGSMAYTKYSPVMRWMLKRISRKAGGPIDTSRDHELTDWEQVKHFAESFAAKASRPDGTRPLATAEAPGR